MSSPRSTLPNVDLGDDIVAQGAFEETLKNHKSNFNWPPMFWMHNPENVAGKWLDMDEDKQGLYVKGVLADTQLGNELHTLLKMDAVRGLSIGYRARDYDFDKQGHRILKKIDLWEVSLVSLAMNPLAQVESVKTRLSHAGEYVPTTREFERMLRDVGCTQLTAKRMISIIFDDLGIRDVDQTRDVNHVDSEADAILQALDSTTGRFAAEAFHR